MAQTGWIRRVGARSRSLSLFLSLLPLSCRSPTVLLLPNPCTQFFQGFLGRHRLSSSSFSLPAVTASFPPLLHPSTDSRPSTHYTTTTLTRSKNTQKQSARVRSLTFSSSAELDGDVLVHVLSQIQNVLLLGSLRLSPTLTASPSAAISASTAATTAAATASELAAL